MALYQPSQNRTIPRLAQSPLPPLSKGGGLTARHKLLSCCVLIATHLPFLFTKLFCRQDGGIVTPPTLPNPHYPLLCTTTLASLVKGEVLSPEKIRATTGGIAFLPHPFRLSDTSVNNPSIVGSASHCNRSSPLHKGAKGDGALPTLLKPHYPSKIANILAS